MSEWEEAKIIINGVTLTDAQSGVLRVALEQFNPDCGDDEIGQHLTELYRQRWNEIRAALYASRPPDGKA